MRCRRTSTFSASAARFAFSSGRTLKPITIAFDAAARVISDSLIAPAPLVNNFNIYTLNFNFLREAATASAEP